MQALLRERGTVGNVRDKKSNRVPVVFIQLNFLETNVASVPCIIIDSVGVTFIICHILHIRFSYKDICLA